MSSPAYNAERPDLIIMAVTSQLRPTNHFGEVVVGQWQQAGLLKPSATKPVITTIEKGLVIKSMGKLSGEDQRALREAVGMIVG
ncbi:MAG: type II toxin-antitoxin system PemK/MazF family toxin [Acidiferrobacterales bacterium]